MKVEVVPPLYSARLDTMNFLNEVVSRYPEAVSFAPGRPWESFFAVEEALRGVAPFAERSARASGRSRGEAFDALGQYGRTNGILGAELARHLERDEGIRAAPEAIMVTAGAQEAMLILLMGLFDPGRDALLVSDPSYIGITGLAALLGIPMLPVPARSGGVDPDDVERAVAEARGRGLRPRALYVIPDFDNPSGESLSFERRRRLLEIAREEGLLLFEDSPYRMFAYDEPPPPSLKSLDRDGVVVLFGSFSKTLFPGLRIGYLVADQEVEGEGGGATLAAVLSKVKSLTSVNTPPINQAVVGQILADAGGSLRSLVEERLPFYRRNRDRMLDALERRLGRFAGRGVSWNRPGGGFFLTLTLPFPFDAEACRAAAADYGVIACPMSFFSLTDLYEHEARLSFSYVSEDEIERGVEALARFVGDRLAG